jgi:hypothetical protein
VHRFPVAVGDADQIANLHLTEAQWHIAPINLPADLNYPGALADTPVADDAGGQIGFGNNLFEYRFHLFNIHDSLTSDSSSLNRNKIGILCQLFLTAFLETSKWTKLH